MLGLVSRQTQHLVRKDKIMPFLFAKDERSVINRLPIDEIIPSEHQPRRIFSDKSLCELSESIKQHGVLQPILVIKKETGYQLIAGERRLRASKLAGLDTIPAIIADKNSKDCAQIALIENIQREQLSFFEEAEGYRRLIEEFGFSQTDIAKAVSKKQCTVSNRLRLLKLPPAAQAIITANGLTERHARLLLKISDKQMLYTALDRIVDKKLNVIQSEEYVESLISPKQQKSVSCKITEVKLCINTLNKAVRLITKSGIKPETRLCESDGFVEYIIKIPKVTNLNPNRF